MAIQTKMLRALVRSKLHKTCLYLQAHVAFNARRSQADIFVLYGTIVVPRQCGALLPVDNNTRAIAGDECYHDRGTLVYPV